MNKVIEDIVKRDCSKKEKEKALNKLMDEINIARDILSGKFKYCPDCDDYYLTRSFLSDSEDKQVRICTYQDPINSGGNEYEDGIAHITYSICPKGHKHEVRREERRR